MCSTARAVAPSTRRGSCNRWRNLSAISPEGPSLAPSLLASANPAPPRRSPSQSDARLGGSHADAVVEDDIRLRDRVGPVQARLVVRVVLAGADVVRPRHQLRDLSHRGEPDLHEATVVGRRAPVNGEVVPGVPADGRALPVVARAVAVPHPETERVQIDEHRDCRRARARMMLPHDPPAVLREARVRDQRRLPDPRLGALGERLGGPGRDLDPVTARNLVAGLQLEPS